MEIIKKHTVAFTGHRNYNNNSDDLRLFSDPRSLEQRLREAIIEAVECGYNTFLTGMADGFDLLAGEVVLQLKAMHYPNISLVGVVPFRAQAAGFSEANRVIYDRVLNGCDMAIVLKESYAPLCYFARNDYLVDHSSLLIAYYNGKKGGTAYTVKRALKNGLKINNLY